MSIESVTTIHRIKIFDVEVNRGKSFGLERSYRYRGTIPCRVVPMDAAKIAFFKQQSQDIDHDLWFSEDPKLTEENVVVWIDADGSEIRKMRIKSIPKDAHGLGRIWKSVGYAKGVENLSLIE